MPTAWATCIWVLIAAIRGVLCCAQSPGPEASRVPVPGTCTLCSSRSTAQQPHHYTASLLVSITPSHQRCPGRKSTQTARCSAKRLFRGGNPPNTRTGTCNMGGAARGARIAGGAALSAAFGYCLADAANDAITFAILRRSAPALATPTPSLAATHGTHHPPCAPRGRIHTAEAFPSAPQAPQGYAHV